MRLAAGSTATWLAAHQQKIEPSVQSAPPSQPGSDTTKSMAAPNTRSATACGAEDWWCGSGSTAGMLWRARPRRPAAGFQFSSGRPSGR